MATTEPSVFGEILAGLGFRLERQLLGTNVRGVGIARTDEVRALVTLVDPGAADDALEDHPGWDLPLLAATGLTTGIGPMLLISERLPDDALEATSPGASMDRAAADAGARPPRFVAELAGHVAAEHDAGGTVGRLHPALVFVDPADGRLRGIAQRPLRAAREASIPDAVPPMLDATFMSPAEFRGERPDPKDDVFRLATLVWHWRHGADPFEDIPRTTRIPMLAGALDPPPIDGDALDKVLWAALASDPRRRPTAQAIVAALRNAARW